MVRLLVRPGGITIPISPTPKWEGAQEAFFYGQKMTITPEYLHECFDVDADRGVLTWRQRPRNHFKTENKWVLFNKRHFGNKVGWVHNEGYLIVRLDGKQLRVHNLLWAMIHGSFPAQILDHIDGNRSNNRPSNLRECTHAENHRNVRVHNPIGLKGVQKSGKKFTSKIRFDHKIYHLGTFQTAEEAHSAYCKAAKKYHGEFANFEVKMTTPTIQQGAGQTNGEKA